MQTLLLGTFLFAEIKQCVRKLAILKLLKHKLAQPAWLRG